MAIQIKVITSAVEEVAGALGVIAYDAAPDLPLAEQSGWLADLRARGEFTGKLYETVTLHKPQGLAASRLILVGGGKRESFSAAETRRTAGALVRLLKAKAVRSVAFLLESPSDELVAAAVEGAILAAWEPDKYKTDPKKIDRQIDDFTLVVPGGDQTSLEAAAERGRIIAEAQNLTRDLVNEPANRLTPADLVKAARSVAEELGSRNRCFGSRRHEGTGHGRTLGCGPGKRQSALSHRLEIPSVAACRR